MAAEANSVSLLSWDESTMMAGDVGRAKKSMPTWKESIEASKILRKKTAHKRQDQQFDERPQKGVTQMGFQVFQGQGAANGKQGQGAGPRWRPGERCCR